jgi:hypothetical protein
LQHFALFFAHAFRRSPAPDVRRPDEIWLLIVPRLTTMRLFDLDWRAQLTGATLRSLFYCRQGGFRRS